jgi:hypothetical protein
VEHLSDSKVHEFSSITIDSDGQGVSGLHDNELFFNCVFKKLNGLTLKNCDLNGSKFITDDLRDALGFTLTLDCHSFSNVEYSELLFDLFLLMAYKSKGNDVKREKLLDVVGKERAEKLLNILAWLER